MSNHSGYIHINEAVKVYKKTRQTFYNYVNKDLIQTQKVNNKLYLNIADIEQLLSPYIETSSTTENSPASTGTSLDLDSIENSITEKLEKFESDLLLEIKNTLFHYKQQLETAQQQALQEFQSRLYSTTFTQNTGSLVTKKYQFYLGYIGFVAINIIIFGMIF